MTNTFLNRVSAERRILAVINKYAQRKFQLAGLSEEAINRWREKIGFKETEAIIPQLRELSELCHRLSDRSHETFHSIDESKSAEVSKRIEDFDRSIAHWKERLTKP